MDTSNWRPNQGGSGSGDSSMESVDWRTQLSADSRQKIANKIMDVLKKHLPFGQEKLNELKNIALRFEEKIYTAATSQADYMRKISIKLMAMENRSANPIPNPLQQNSGGNSVNPSDTGSQSQGMQQVNSQSQPLPIPVPSNHPQPGAQQSQSQILPQNTNNNNIASQSTMPNISAQSSSFQNMPNISGVQQNPVGNNMGQGIPPSANNFISQRQIQGSQQLNPLQQSQNSQQYLYQQQLHQIAKQKLQQQQQQQNNNNNAATSHIQQQHHNLLPPGHFPPPSLSTLQQNQQPVLQHHQQSVIRQQRQQPNPMGQLSSYSDMQQPRLLRHQNNLSNVQQPHQQQSIGQRNNFSAMHQQQHQLLNNQDSGQLLQSKVSIPQQNQPTQGQRAPELQQQVVMPQLQAQSGQQLQHQLNMKPQPNMSQRDMQQRLPAPGAFQQQNLMSDQQKQLFQQQRAMPEASSTSSDSTAQTGNPNAGDWQEELYQKMKGLKDKYMPELNDVYHKITARLQLPDSHPHQPKGEQVDRIKAYKTALDRVLTFLQIPKSNISPQFKDKLAGCEANIHSLIGTNKRKNGVMMQQTQSNMTHMQPNENQINLQGTMASIRGASNAKANMIGGIQPTSNLDGGPNNTMNSLQQLTGGTQQVNVNPLTSSQGGMSMLQHQQLKQLHQRQMQQQLLHKQQLLQQQQLHRQTKQQVNHLPQQIGIKSESLQQQRPSYHQSLKPGGPFSPQLLPPSSTSSPTIPQHLSPQTDQQSLLNSFTKSGTPLQSANSPFIVSSPSTPSTSHFPGDSEKVNSGVSSLSNAGNVGSQPTQSLAIGTPGISASPLLAEFTSPDGNQGNGAASVSGKSSSAEEPIDHLLKVVSNQF